MCSEEWYIDSCMLFCRRCCCVRHAVTIPLRTLNISIQTSYPFILFSFFIVVLAVFTKNSSCNVLYCYSVILSSRADSIPATTSWKLTLKWLVCIWKTKIQFRLRLTSTVHHCYRLSPHVKTFRYITRHVNICVHVCDSHEIVSFIRFFKTNK